MRLTKRGEPAFAVSLQTFVFEDLFCGAWVDGLRIFPDPPRPNAWKHVDCGTDNMNAYLFLPGEPPWPESCTCRLTLSQMVNITQPSSAGRLRQRLGFCIVRCKTKGTMATHQQVCSHTTLGRCQDISGY